MFSRSAGRGSARHGRWLMRHDEYRTPSASTPIRTLAVNCLNCANQDGLIPWRSRGLLLEVQGASATFGAWARAVIHCVLLGSAGCEGKDEVRSSFVPWVAATLSLSRIWCQSLVAKR